MRLTTKGLIDNVKTDGIPYLERYKKLSQLEDIEQELGIDLIPLFKALKNGIWSKGTSQLDELYICPYFIDVEELEMGHKYDNKSQTHTLCLFKTENSENKNGLVRIKDYGKTWTLTKGELL